MLLAPRSPSTGGQGNESRLSFHSLPWLPGRGWIIRDLHFKSNSGTDTEPALASFTTSPIKASVAVQIRLIHLLSTILLLSARRGIFIPVI